MKGACTGTRSNPSNPADQSAIRYSAGPANDGRVISESRRRRQLFIKSGAKADILRSTQWVTSGLMHRSIIRSPRRRGSAEPGRRRARALAPRRRGQKKARRLSWSRTSTSVSGAVLVNIPTLERWQLVQTTTVAIACTTRVYASPHRLGGREGTRAYINITISVTRIECFNTRQEKHCKEYGDEGKRWLAAFHDQASYVFQIAMAPSWTVMWPKIFWMHTDSTSARAIDRQGRNGLRNEALSSGALW
jgi:hypothetical protein